MIFIRFSGLSLLCLIDASSHLSRSLLIQRLPQGPRRGLGVLSYSFFFLIVPISYTSSLHWGQGMPFRHVTFSCYRDSRNQRTVSQDSHTACVIIHWRQGLTRNKGAGRAWSLDSRVGYWALTLFSSQFSSLARRLRPCNFWEKSTILIRVSTDPIKHN